MRRLAAALLLAATGCVFGGDDRPPFHDRDASLVLPTPDAPVQPDADWTEGSACDLGLPCPSASTGKTTVCGRLYDVETDARIGDAWSPMTCGAGGVGEACTLQVRPYDADAYAANPSTATPLPFEKLLLDDCGRFVLRNVSTPSPRVVALVLDDAAGSPDLRRATVTAFHAVSMQVRTNHRAYTIRRATDETWTAGAGLDGATLVDRGVLWATFRDGTTPVAGVQITGADGAPRPLDDLYFSDVDPLTRATIAPDQAATGNNGSALLLGSALGEHAGAGGERDGCTWSGARAASIPGVLFVAASQLGSGDTACP